MVVQKFDTGFGFRDDNRSASPVFTPPCIDTMPNSLRTASRRLVFRTVSSLHATFPQSLHVRREMGLHEFVAMLNVVRYAANASDASQKKLKLYFSQTRNGQDVSSKMESQTKGLLTLSMDGIDSI